ncbi:Uncharacterised protein [Salmonella enterica subsp. arizonae]|uniref:PAAR domain-containing protein n=1 Tax=Salmonella enterica subsp. arizonae TaxID=59203 RepID=A0A2X4THR4_SALER|nr:Uncharacterised protein [Salmonella enterica subsp. arizonae]
MLQIIRKGDKTTHGGSVTQIAGHMPKGGKSGVGPGRQQS